MSPRITVFTKTYGKPTEIPIWVKRHVKGLTEYKPIVARVNIEYKEKL